MSQNNGDRILKIDLKGRRKIDIGGLLMIEVDVVAVHNAFSELDATFRDEKREIPPERVADYNRALCEFVKGIILHAAEAANDAKALNEAHRVVGMMSMADFLHLLRELSDEARDLQHFFEPKSREKPSSQESTELRFST